MSQHKEIRSGCEAPTESSPLIAGKQEAGLLHFCSQLEKNFGIRLIVILFFTQHVIKGFVSDFTGSATPYLFKEYGVAASDSQIFGSVISLPFAMKPIIGLVSDLYPIQGYRKAPYMIMSSCLALAAIVAIGLTTSSTLTIRMAVICIFLLSLQCATCDLLTEATYAERIAKKPAAGPDMLTYVWFGMTFATLLSSSCSGYVIEHYGSRVAFLFCVLPVGIVMFPVARGYLEEASISKEEAARLRKAHLKQKEACVLCILIIVATLSMMVCGIVIRDPIVNGCLSIFIGVLVVVTCSVLLSPPLAKFNAFSVIQSSLTLSIGGASFYFFTDDERQYPEGPHFTPFFFNTVIGVLGSLCSLLGIYLYNRYMAQMEYRSLLVVTNVGYSVLALTDVAIYARLNIRYGIPDHFFVLSSGALESVVGMWAWMPQVLILSYLCPDGMEATMYALLAGCSNLGNTIASNVGAMMLQFAHCEPNGSANESEQFKNLWMLALICTLLPCVIIVALIWLVPDVKQGSVVLEEGLRRDATVGSLWRRWTEGEEEGWRPRIAESSQVVAAAEQASEEA
eukprot:TRINITY_DN64433_c0_g1_i1.p1 TRINITY_DN64433_c0_g1~~TRINITY_DN64433_c0_g1_i1.p1  ORF type:complete len:567 (+),score=73.51 TRINITY_DN64433_c0_g1_i1:92-1792(+)